MNESGKLNPCPFCGEVEDVGIRKQRVHGVPLSINGLKYWYVNCYECDARTGKCFDEDSEYLGFENGREHAIFLWNMREQVQDNHNQNDITFVRNAEQGLGGDMEDENDVWLSCAWYKNNKQYKAFTRRFENTTVEKVIVDDDERGYMAFAKRKGFKIRLDMKWKFPNTLEDK